jgi:hypothetical protein
MFHAMVATPDAIALPSDARPRHDARIFQQGAGAAAAAATREAGLRLAGEGSGGGAAQGGAAGRPGGCGAGGCAGECVRSMVGMAQCASGAWGACCDAMAGWRAAGCWCNQEGGVLLASMPQVLGPAVLGRLTSSCGLEAPERVCISGQPPPDGGR